MLAGAVAAVATGVVVAAKQTVSDDVIAGQRAALSASTSGAGFGPQAPRDIDNSAGANMRLYESAPDFDEMNLCNIHFHAAAEHRGGQFTRYAGNGNGSGYGTGFQYNGELSAAEMAPLDEPIGEGKQPLQSGDTIEVHYVHTTAQVEPGPTLGSCLSDAIANPQLRVETQVYVLVNDRSALDFQMLTAHALVDGFHQALNIPDDTGDPIQYRGSTTGPSYNEKGSPFQVSWSVRPRVAKVDILTVDKWFADNVFDEKGAHAVRNLVTNQSLLSRIDG